MGAYIYMKIFPLYNTDACLQDKVTTSADQSCSEEACRVRINGETFTVKHGSIVLDPRRCSQCVCMNGELRSVRLWMKTAQYWTQLLLSLAGLRAEEKSSMETYLRCVVIIVAIILY